MDLTNGFTFTLLSASLLLGMRHGIDWDHIAAITDIAATQETPRRSIFLGTIYALGHAVVVFAIGIVVITVGGSLPPTIDAAMGRVVGWTLILLGVYVVFSLIRDRGDVRLRSRWMLLFDLVRAVRGRLRRLGDNRETPVVHDHTHADVGGLHHAAAPAPGLPADTASGGRFRAPTHSHRHAHLDEAGYSTGSAALIGMLHGVGAETPTQVVIFLAAANAGGVATGLVILLVFVIGLVIANTGITLASAAGFFAAGRRRSMHVALGAVTAVMSLVIGTMLVFGLDGALPALFAG